MVVDGLAQARFLLQLQPDGGQPAIHRDLMTVGRALIGLQLISQELLGIDRRGSVLGRLRCFELLHPSGRSDRLGVGLGDVPRSSELLLAFLQEVGQLATVRCWWSAPVLVLVQALAQGVRGGALELRPAPPTAAGRGRCLGLGLLGVGGGDSVTSVHDCGGTGPRVRS